MEKRFLLAFLLSIIVLFGWQLLFPRPKPAKQPAEITGPVAVEPESESAGPAELERPVEGMVGREYDAVAAEAVETIDVGNGLFHVRLTNQGGRVVSWRLLDYTTSDGEPLDLIPAYEGELDRFPLAVELDDRSLAERVNGALFQVQRDLAEGGGERVQFFWSDGTGLEVTKTLIFWPEDYLVDVDLEVRDRGRRLPARLIVGPGFGAQDPRATRSTYAYANQVVWNLQGSVRHTRQKKAAEARLAGPFVWAGLEDQYFAALLLPGTPEAAVDVSVAEMVRAAPEGSEDEPERVPSVGVVVPPGGLLLFVGPKDYTMLRDLGHELEKVVWFSSNGFLYAIAKSIFLALLWVYDHTIPNYGMAIVLTTFVLRMLLFPLNQYSMVKIKKSQTEMQRLQPKIQGIRNKYKKHKDAESRAKMNKETMALYKEEGVNPMGGVTGCLPMLAQFPILIGFYNMLTVAVELRGAPFYGWIRDLSVPDPYWITPLMMGATMFWQQKMSLSKVTDPQQRQQQRIMMFMPVFFTVICIQMPSGLVLYWFVNNILGIVQQRLVNRRAESAEAALQEAQKTKKAKAKTKAKARKAQKA